jgi:hypothetical protein
MKGLYIKTYLDGMKPKVVMDNAINGFPAWLCSIGTSAVNPKCWISDISSYGFNHGLSAEDCHKFFVSEDELLAYIRMVVT